MSNLRLDLNFQGPYAYFQVKIDINYFLSIILRFNTPIFTMRNKKHLQFTLQSSIDILSFKHHREHQLIWPLEQKYSLTNPPKSAPQLSNSHFRQLHQNSSHVIATLTIPSTVPGRIVISVQCSHHTLTSTCVMCLLVSCMFFTSLVLPLSFAHLHFPSLLHHTIHYLSQSKFLVTRYTKQRELFSISK